MNLENFAITAFFVGIFFMGGVVIFSKEGWFKWMGCAAISTLALIISGIAVGSLGNRDDSVPVKLTVFGQIYERTNPELLTATKGDDKKGVCIYLQEVTPDGTRIDTNQAVFFIPQGQWYPPVSAMAACVKYANGTKQLAPYTRLVTNIATEVIGK